jgi:hypothetical protein
MNRNNRRVPLEKRKRTETSCDKCKSRKQKCDRLLGQEQCRYCEIHNIQCTTTQPRKMRIYESVEGVGSRLALLESLVKGLLPEADLSSNTEMLQLGRSLGIPLPVVEEVHRKDVNKTVTKQEDENTLPLLPDQQGQVQYIGPASSFQFHLTLRRLMGNYSSFEFAMFGRNAADPYDVSAVPTLFEKGDAKALQDPRNLSPDECSSPSEAVKEIDGPVLDALIDAYFDTIHSDFPVLHEASFRESYEIWVASTAPPDPAWFCVLLCVLILARRIAPFEIPEAAEKQWWRHSQKLLPTVFFTSNMFAVQALMLAALHLHNTEHRDACWNLTGTAVRIGFAIGLHRDDVKHAQSPLGRELRKQLWWTLYAFEQMQVSSYDRPSAILSTISSVGYPNERIVGVAGHCPQDLLKWSQRLALLLGSACRALDPTGNSSDDDSYSRPLSPAAGILRDLNRWKEALPAHLRLNIADSLAPQSQRPLLLLHAQYYYTIVLVSRSALLRRATLLGKNPNETLPPPMVTVSETCIIEARELGRILHKLETIGKFNSRTWWDCFYTVASALVLVLDIFCSSKQNSLVSSQPSQTLLRELSTLMKKHLKSPMMPGSLRMWGKIVVDVSSLAEQFKVFPHHEQQVNEPTLSSSFSSHLQADDLPPVPDLGPDPGMEAFPAPGQEITLSAAVSPEDSHLARENANQFWAQLSFMHDPNKQMQDWGWDDIGALLRGDVFAQQ